MNPKTLCDQYTKEQLAEKVVELRAELKLRPPKLPDHEIADSAQWWKEKYDELKSENAELKKFLKHARDDKKIRLGEIEVLEAKVVELRSMVAHLQGQCDGLRDKERTD